VDIVQFVFCLTFIFIFGVAAATSPFYIKALFSEHTYPKSVDSSEFTIYYSNNKTIIEFDGHLEQVGLYDTHSMEPMMGSGNLILTKEVDNNTELRKGSVITFKNGQGPEMMHQIVDILDECYHTKGLNNPATDKCVTRDQITGLRVLAIDSFDFEVQK